MTNKEYADRIFLEDELKALREVEKRSWLSSSDLIRKRQILDLLKKYKPAKSKKKEAA